MRGFCGKCGRTFDGQMLCPLCGVQLDGDPEAGALPLSIVPADETPDGPSLPRRLVFGGITLLGLYHGLKHLALAGVLAQTGLPALSSNSHLSLLIVATLVACVVAGTVNRRAELTGLFLALTGGAAFLGPDLLHGGAFPDEWLIGVPTLLLLVGLVGGLSGRLMVPPAPNLPTFGRLDSRVVVRVKRRPVRIAWVQMILGIAIAIGGAVYADDVRTGLSYVLAGQGSSFGARPLVAWQISALAALVGGAVAGLNTRGGFRQALFAGLGAGAAVVPILSAPSETGPSPVIDFWINQLDLKTAGPLPYLALAVTTCLATFLGAWFGSHLKPAIELT